MSETEPRLNYKLTLNRTDKSIDQILHKNLCALKAVELRGGPPSVAQKFPFCPGEAWICPFPERLYDNFNTAYHVTGSLALEHMLAGQALVPSYELYFSEHHNIAVSHRGAAEYVVEDLLISLGIPWGGNECLVWAGKTVDNQQVGIERDISAHPGRGSKLVYEALFERYIPELPGYETPDNRTYLYRYNEGFQDLMNNLKNGRNLTEKNREIIDKVLHAVAMAKGLRATAYQMLYNRLLGIDPISPELHETFQILFENNSTGIKRPVMDKLVQETQNQSSLQPGQAVVLSFNPKKLLLKHKKPLLVFPGPLPRDVTSIIGVDYVEIDDIDKKIYLSDPASISDRIKKDLISRHITIASVDDIPPDKRLDPSQGFKGTISELEPINPMCLMRYARERTKRQVDYAKQFKQGNLTPLYGFLLENGNPAYSKACDAVGDQILPNEPGNQRYLRGVLN